MSRMKNVANPKSEQAREKHSRRKPSGAKGKGDNPDVTPQSSAVKAISQPQFRILDRDECEAIIARNHVGRIAYARRNSISILPIYYAYSERWVYGRMKRSRKNALVGHHGWWPVAFQVDEVEDLFHWRTVLVHGGFYALPADGGPSELDARRQAIDVLRRVIPQTFHPGDPMPSHTGIFKIAVQQITGSEASPGSQAGLAS